MKGRAQHSYGRLVAGVLVVMFVAAGTVSAQQPLKPSHPSVSGTVIDPLGNPVPFAYVAVAVRGAHTVANAEGQFRLPLTQGDSAFVLVVRRIGFIPVDKTVSMSEYRATEIRIEMRPLLQELATVRVDASPGYGVAGHLAPPSALASPSDDRRAVDS